MTDPTVVPADAVRGRRIENDIARPACMMCGRTKWDQDESEKHDDGMTEWWVLWTYCRACDCWTEHRPNGMPDYL